MRALLPGLLFLFAASLPCDAADRPAFTQMEAGPYGRADRVVLAQLDRVIDVAPRKDGRRGPQLVHASVLQVLKGAALTAKSKQITIRISGPRPTLDPERPSRPYLNAGSQGRFVFFLTRRAGGHAYDMDALFEAESDAGKQKVQALAKIAILQRERDDERRARATLDWLVGAQRARSRWARINAARELNFLVDKRPDLFDTAVRTRLGQVPSTRMPREQRVWLQRLFLRIGESGSAAALSAPAPKESAWREAWRKALDEKARDQLIDARLAQAKSSALANAYGDLLWVWDRAGRDAVRIAMLDKFARGSHQGVRAPLRGRYADIESLAVREAYVRMLGFLGDDQDVIWLQHRLVNRALRRTALLALARIRTSAALEVLRAEHKLAADGDEDAREQARWIAHLLADAFVESERRAGHAIGPR